MSRLQSRIAAAIVAAAAVGLLVAPLTASAATSMLIKGTVSCSSGQPAVGVWIESSAGGSEWGDDQSWQFATSGSNASYRYFEETISSPSSKSTISLHVGCGNTPAKWGKDLWSKGYPVGSSGRTINVACDYSKPSRTTGACKEAPAGEKLSSNPYEKTIGYCTGGAVEQWYKATGYWPFVNRDKSYSTPKDKTSPGDAKWIDDNALSRGFKVTAIPHARSMVVFNTRSKWGHVGWVTKIYRTGSTVYFDYVDRNGSGPVNSIGKGPAYGKDLPRYKEPWSSTTQRFVVAPVYPK